MVNEFINSLNQIINMDMMKSKTRKDYAGQFSEVTNKYRKNVGLDAVTMEILPFEMLTEIKDCGKCSASPLGLCVEHKDEVRNFYRAARIIIQHAEYAKTYYKNHKEDADKSSKKWRVGNKEKWSDICRRSGRKWRELHRPEYNARAKRIYNNDIYKYRAYNRLRRRKIEGFGCGENWKKCRNSTCKGCVLLVKIKG